MHSVVGLEELYKMRKQAVTLLSVLGLFFLMHTVTALKCYNCTKCNDPFHSKDVKTSECSGVCVKGKAEANGKIDGVDVKEGDVMRTCAKTKEKTGCEKKEIEGVKGITCFCDKELCNGSNALEVSMATGIMAIAAAVLKPFL